MNKKYSQLTAMRAIAKASFRSITRSPSAVVFTLLFPLIFILVFGFLEDRGFTPKIGLDPESDTVNPVYERLIQSSGIELHQLTDSAELHRMLAKGRLDALVNIRRNPDAEGPPWIFEVTTSSAGAARNPAVMAILDHLIQGLNLAAIPAHQLTASMQTQVVQGRTYTGIDFILPGQLGFSILSAGVFGTAFVFFNLRQTLVIKRFFATPIQKPYILMGEALSRLVFSVAGALILISIGYFAFGFTLVNGLQTLLTMLLLSAFGLIIFMGFGFIISGLARNDSMIPPLANIVTLPQFLLSGTFFPITSFPGWLQPVCKSLPLTYLNDALRQVAFEGAGLTDIGLDLGVLAGWGVLVYALATRFFRWE